MNLLITEEINSYDHILFGEYQAGQFSVGLKGADSKNTVASIAAFYDIPNVGAVEVGRWQISGERQTLVEVPLLLGTFRFSLTVFDWIKLPLSLTIWEIEVFTVGKDRSNSILFDSIGDTVIAGDSRAVYVGSGEDFWLVGCRSGQEISSERFQFSCGAGRAVAGLSSDTFEEPRWWKIDVGWYVHGFNEIRAVYKGTVPKDGYFAWSPLDDLGILIEGIRVRYQIKKAGESDYQTVYERSLTVAAALYPVMVLGPQAFIYNANFPG